MTQIGTTPPSGQTPKHEVTNFSPSVKQRHACSRIFYEP